MLQEYDRLAGLDLDHEKMLVEYEKFCYAAAYMWAVTETQKDRMH
jgi:hypothetical protein